MNDHTRRGFLVMAGAGAAVAGAAAVAPSAAAATVTPTAAPAVPELPDDATGSLVAYVHDATTGEVAVMVEGREVIVTDRGLVAAMHRALAGASRLS